MNKKIVQGPTSFFRGLWPQKKEVLHDTLQDITEFLLTQAGPYGDQKGADRKAHIYRVEVIPNLGPRKKEMENYECYPTVDKQMHV